MLFLLKIDAELKYNFDKYTFFSVVKQKNPLKTSDIRHNYSHFRLQKSNIFFE